MQNTYEYTGIYENLEKLPAYHLEFAPKKVLLAGGGAVGSYAAEEMIKMGTGNIIIVDNDRYEAGNMAKSSPLIRYPEDVGKPKAVALSKRSQSLMIPNGRTNALQGSIMNVGPMALAECDYIFIALDNYAAKIYLNQIWRQIPEAQRPVVIMGGTYEECASSVILHGHGKGLCIRCLVDEKWLVDSEKRHSCSEPQYRENEDGMKTIVVTSGLASSMAASLMCEQYRADVLEMVHDDDHSLYYTAYPKLEIAKRYPMLKTGCPDCRKYHPPKEIHYIQGDVMHLTIADLIHNVTEYLGTEKYYIRVHHFEYANIEYSEIITTDYCKGCGTPIELYEHESKVRREDILCDECKEKKTKIKESTDPILSSKKIRTINAISPKHVDSQITDRTLFSLGWPIGSYIEVVLRSSDADCLDEDWKLMIFTCQGDKELVFQNLIFE